MGTLFSGPPSPPKLPPPPPPAPKMSDQAVRNAQAQAKKQAAALYAADSTILTSSQGLTTTPYTAGKTLLGT